MRTTTHRRPGFSSKPHYRSSRRPKSSHRRSLVLVADDCECVRDTIRFVLRRMMGVRVMVAENSAEGLRLARQRKFDVVTSDINRPGLNGLSFLRVLKRVQPTTRVVVISGALDEATACRAKWLRALDSSSTV